MSNLPIARAVNSRAEQQEACLSLGEPSLTGSKLSQISQTREKAPRFLVLKDVVVTGVGTLLANCDDRTTFWRQLANGESQLSLEQRAEGTVAVARIVDFESSKYLSEIPERHYRRAHREHQLYLACLAQAIRDAGLTLDEVRGRPVGLYDGTSRGCLAYWYELLSTRLRNNEPFTMNDISPGMPGQAAGLGAAVFGLTGPTSTFNGTCASGAIAFGHAYRELQTGRTEMALVTGHDAALIDPIFQMYADAGLLSTGVESSSTAIAPFSGHCGNAFGEGAVTLVLETKEHAAARGAHVLAEVVGFRQGNAGQHPTDVDFSASRAAELIEDVLHEAESDAEGLDFVIGHGNGVRTSDVSELNYMARVFGRSAARVPLLSTKPVYGHTLGASSAVSIAAAALMLERDYVIPTVGVDPTKTIRGFRHQAGSGESRKLRAGVVVGYGIGGQNAAVMLRKARP